MAHEIEAFLTVIRYCEGTAGSNGYRTLFGGKLFDSYEKHPKIYGTFKLKGKEYKSSAAGAYQFLWGTWKVLATRHGYEDFSPANQDKGAIELIKGRRAYSDVLSGNIKEALIKCNKEWASLPGSPYGQPTKTMDECIEVYEKKLGELNG